ncbi:MAG: hypothetical protein LBP96_05340 [Bacteroidales bacterium]|nr:hypothetical protein [Bacteroidales bacterium]
MKKIPTQKTKIQDQPHAKKVGRLTQPVANAIRRKAADVYITDNYIKHIFIGHENDLGAVGLTPLQFVEIVANGYNRVYKGSGQSLLLVKWNGNPKVAAIEMNLAFKKEFYEIKTAQIREKRRFKVENLLWKKNERNLFQSKRPVLTF